MNTAIQCIILLVCTTLCTSAVIRTGCQCVQTNKSVIPRRIADIKIYDPRPHCSKQEIIVMLKDGSSRCLDPKQTFIQEIAEDITSC